MNYFAHLVALAAITTAVNAAVLDKTVLIGKTPIQYKVVLPAAFDAAEAYPAVLAFSGGGQTMDIVEYDVENVWREQAEKRGYIVVIPAAPGDDLFFMGGGRIFPEFLEVILRDYKIRDRRFHAAGTSNGGISAFSVAAANPQYFVSITTFPGYLNNNTPDRMAAIAPLCISMFAGALDPDWAESMKAQAEQFRMRGLRVSTSVERGQTHRIATLRGKGASRLFDQFDACPKGTGK